MNETTAYVIGGALLALVIIVLAVGRIRGVDFSIGKFFKAGVKADGATGSSISKVGVDGSGNDISTKGAGSKISNVEVEGDDNKFRAEN